MYTYIYLYTYIHMSCSRDHRYYNTHKKERVTYVYIAQKELIRCVYRFMYIHIHNMINILAQDCSCGHRHTRT